MTIGELTNGMKVMSADGKSLGKIIRIEATSFLVEKGFFFPKDYEVSTSLVREIRDDGCWLSVRHDELEREGEALAGGTYGGDRGSSSQRPDTEREGEQRLTLSEEELDVRKRVREAGEVRVTKEVVTEHRQIDVPVMKEQVHVERVPASSTSAPQGEAFREESIRVPVREEEIEVTKRPRVREEVRVTKTAQQQERRVEGEVRREEARIDLTDDQGERGRETGAEGTETLRGDEPGGFRRGE